MTVRSCNYHQPDRERGHRNQPTLLIREEKDRNQLKWCIRHYNLIFYGQYTWKDAEIERVVLKSGQPDIVVGPATVLPSVARGEVEDGERGGNGLRDAQLETIG